MLLEKYRHFCLQLTRTIVLDKERWKNFGRWMRETREAKRLSQEGLARRIGIDRQQVYRLEGGLSGTRRETVLKIAEALEQSPAEALNMAGFAIPRTPGRISNGRELLEVLEASGIEIPRFFGGTDRLDLVDEQELNDILELMFVHLRHVAEKKR